MSRSILIALSLCALGKERKEPTTFEGQYGKRQPSGPNEERRGDAAHTPPMPERPEGPLRILLVDDRLSSAATWAREAARLDTRISLR